MKPGVIKEQVEEEFVSVHLDPVLVAHEGEAGAHFDEEILQAVNQCFFDGAFGSEFIERCGFEDVGIFEDLARQIGLWRRQREREVRGGFAEPLMQVRVELVNEDAARPTMLDGLANVKRSCLRILHAIDQDAIMFPGNLGTKLVHNFAVRPGWCTIMESSRPRPVVCTWWAANQGGIESPVSAFR